MNYLSKVILCMVLLSTSLSSLAIEVIRVAVVFDTGTTSISSSQRYNIARAQVDFLNDTIFHSGLSNDIQFQLVVDKAIKFASTFDDFDDVQNKYLNVMSTNFDTKTPSLQLNKVSRDSQVDIVIAIFNPWGDNDIGGRALMVPDKNMGESVANVLSFADAGIVFIHEDSVNDYTMAPHEVGHSFGLFHGNAVAEYTGESGHYTPLSAVDNTGHHLELVMERL